MNSEQFTVSFPALGGMAVVGVTAERALDRARAAAADVIGELDRTCSRFRDDSELTALNAAAGTWSDVSPMLRDAIAAALRAARLTDGDVDPTIGRALIALGYDRDFDEIRADARDHVRVGARLADRRARRAPLPSPRRAWRHH